MMNRSHRPASSAPPKRRSGRAAALAAFAALALACACAGTASPASADAVPTTRIVGGGPIAASAAPWQAVLYDQRSLSQRPFCGGSLIRPRIVLTAAHCVRDPNSPFIPHPESIRAVLGRTTFKSTEGFDTRVIGVVSDPTYIPSVPDPKQPGGFISDPRGGDAAILILEQPVPSSIATTIMLAGPGEKPLWRPGKTASVSGFGLEAETATQTSNTLKATSFPILRDSRCQRVYGPNFYAPTQMCAGDLAGTTDACYGDSGGALTVAARGGRGGFVRQAGIVSSGEGCSRPKVPGLYSRVGSARLRKFIQGAVNASPDPGAVVGKDGVCGTGRDLAAKRCGCKLKHPKAKRRACLRKLSAIPSGRG